MITTLDLLLNAGANINARVSDSHTHTAQLVAYVQGRDHEGQTALFAAAEEGWDRVVKPCSSAAQTQTYVTTRANWPSTTPATPRRCFGPTAPRDGKSEDASRVATVALLEAATMKSRIAADTASTR